MVQLTLKQYDGIKDFKYASVKISYSVNTGLGALAEEINRVSGETGVRATYNVTTTGVFAVKASRTADDFSINGVLIGRIDYQDNDQNGALVNAINAVKDTTGVTASIDSNGRLSMTSTDGRAVYIGGNIGMGSGIASSMYVNFGRLSLVKNSGQDILLSGVAQISSGAYTVGSNLIGFAGASTTSQYSMSLRETKAQITAYQRDALGMNSNRFGYFLISQALTAVFGNISLISAGGFANFASAAGLGNITGITAIEMLGFLSRGIDDVMLGDWVNFNTAVIAVTNVGSVRSMAQFVNTTAGVTTHTLHCARTKKTPRQRPTPRAPREIKFFSLIL